MLKALKWAYDLGVRQERVRISAHLQTTQRSAGLERDMMMDMLRDESDKKRANKQRSQRLELAIAVNDRIVDLIDGLFRPEYDVPGGSKMFPEDKHKGEMN